MDKQKFKVGDKIKYKESNLNERPSNDSTEGINEYKILAVDEYGNGYIYKKGNPRGISGSDHKDFTWSVDIKSVEIINSKITNNMNLLEKFALMSKGEPEKSFIKAGVMEMNGKLTEDGKQLFFMFLLKKFGAEFKTEVVDGILAYSEEK